MHSSWLIADQNLACPSDCGELVSSGLPAHASLPLLPQAQIVLMRDAKDGSGTEAYMCGATMITDQIALTAAHCFFGEDGADMQFDFS